MENICIIIQGDFFLGGLTESERRESTMANYEPHPLENPLDAQPKKMAAAEQERSRISTGPRLKLWNLPRELQLHWKTGGSGAWKLMFKGGQHGMYPLRKTGALQKGTLHFSFLFTFHAFYIHWCHSQPARSAPALFAGLQISHPQAHLECAW